MSEKSTDGLLLLEGPATESPERLAELLVHFGQPPTQLNIVTENLEGYFLRMIQNTRRINK